MTPERPSFAADPATAEYYEARAREYDEWYEGAGLFAARDRPGWTDELGELTQVVSRLPPARTLDVACGTAYLTRHLRGFVVGLDRSATMVSLARGRIPGGRALVSDALDPAVVPGSFDRVFTGHFYGHLPVPERRIFLRQARRLAGELVVVDSAARPGVEPEQWQERVLNDGSSHRVFKRYLGAEQLAEEIGGQVLMAGRWFVAARAGAH